MLKICAEIMHEILQSIHTVRFVFLTDIVDIQLISGLKCT